MFTGVYQTLSVKFELAKKGWEGKVFIEFCQTLRLLTAFPHLIKLGFLCRLSETGNTLRLGTCPRACLLFFALEKSWSGIFSS